MIFKYAYVEQGECQRKTSRNPTIKCVKIEAEMAFTIRWRLKTVAERQSLAMSENCAFGYSIAGNRGLKLKNGFLIPVTPPYGKAC